MELIRTILLFEGENWEMRFKGAQIVLSILGVFFAFLFLFCLGVVIEQLIDHTFPQALEVITPLIVGMVTSLISLLGIVISYGKRSREKLIETVKWRRFFYENGLVEEADVFLTSLINSFLTLSSQKKKEEMKEKTGEKTLENDKGQEETDGDVKIVLEDGDIPQIENSLVLGYCQSHPKEYPFLDSDIADHPTLVQNKTDEEVKVIHENAKAHLLRILDEGQSLLVESNQKMVAGSLLFDIEERIKALFALCKELIKEWKLDERYEIAYNIIEGGKLK